MSSHETEILQDNDDDTLQLRAQVKVLVVTTNTDEHNAALSFLMPPLKNSMKLLKYRCYTVGQYGLFKVAVQVIFDLQEPKNSARDANEAFKNLGAVIVLGVTCGVKKNVKRLDVLVSQTLTLCEQLPNHTKIWSDIMYLPSPYDEQFKTILSEWPQNCSIQLSKEPSFQFGNFLCGYSEHTEEIIYNYPNANSIETNNSDLFYKQVLSCNHNLMIVKAVCHFSNNKERKYQPTAALLAANCLNHILNNDKMPEIFENWLTNGKIICFVLHVIVLVTN